MCAIDLGATFLQFDPVGNAGQVLRIRASRLDRFGQHRQTPPLRGRVRMLKQQPRSDRAFLADQVGSRPSILVQQLAQSIGSTVRTLLGLEEGRHPLLTWDLEQELVPEPGVRV